MVPIPDRIDAVLFSFSYSTMHEREKILERYWNALASGGRLVILDLYLPQGTARWQHDMGVWMSQRTLLGRPDVVPWAHLETLAGDVERQERRYYTSRFVVCRAAKT